MTALNEVPRILFLFHENGVSEIHIRFVCNQNLARSQILAAYFEKIFPRDQVDSCGLIAKEGLNLPRVVAEIFDIWGLSAREKTSKNIYAHAGEMTDNTIVVSISSYISEELRNIGFKGRIVDLESYSQKLGVQLRDPQLMARSECAFELSKYVYVAYRCFVEMRLLLPTPPMKAFIPKTYSSLNRAMNYALSSCPTSVTILGDLVVPYLEQNSIEGIEFVKFAVNSRLSEIPSLEFESNVSLYVPANTAQWPVRIYLSQSWRNLFLQAPGHGLALITPPLESGLGGEAASYLAALHSTSLEVVS